MANGLLLASALGQGLEKALGAYQTERGYLDKKKQDEDEQLYKKGLLERQAAKDAQEKAFKESQSAFDREKFAYTKEKDIADRASKEKIAGLIHSGKKTELDPLTGGMKPYQIAERQIPGYELTGEKLPTTDIVKATSKALASKNKIVRQLDDLEKLVEQHGSEVSTLGEVGSEMDRLAREAQLEKKNVEELGAINGSDMKLMEATILNPTSWKAQVMSTNDILNQLRNAKQEVISKTDQQIGLAGYRPKKVQEKQDSDLPPGQTIPNMDQLNPEQKEALRKIRENKKAIPVNMKGLLSEQ